jgi:hypothetical protein
VELIAHLETRCRELRARLTLGGDAADTARVFHNGWDGPAPARDFASKASVVWRDKESGAEMSWACWSVLEAEREASALRAHGHEDIRVELR